MCYSGDLANKLHIHVDDCVVDVVEDDDDDDEEDDENVSVPLTVTMGLVAGYIFMGSLLFGVWENWDWLASAYYCFVTISTIGFGDLVPGSDGLQTTADNLKMIAAAAYIVFGMAIMSMAFNLIQVYTGYHFREWRRSCSCDNNNNNNNKTTIYKAQ